MYHSLRVSALAKQACAHKHKMYKHITMHLDRSLCSHGNLNHHLNTINSEKDKELTFVATGNRSQAKEEEGEKIHSVHLREERKGRGATRWGEEEGGGRNIQYMHQQLISTGRDRYRTEKETHKQIRPIRWCTGGFYLAVFVQ